MNNFFPALGHVEMPPLWPPANAARYAKRSQGGKVPKKKTVTELAAFSTWKINPLS